MYKKIVDVKLALLLVILVISCKRNEPSVPEVEYPIVHHPCTLPGCVDYDYFLIDDDPAWSPDGRFISYFHLDSFRSKTGIYLISSDGRQNRLLHQSLDAASPSWSPDGQWITFSQGAQIWKIQINGRNLTQLTYQGRNFFPSWSPDGKYIVYDSDANSPNGMKFIWKMVNDGSDKVRLAYDPSNGEIRMPHWGTNNLITHIRYVQGHNNPDIYTMDAQGNELKRVTNDGFEDSSPKLSSQGKIIYCSKNNAPPRLWVIDMDGQNALQITQQSSATAAWNPEGTKLVYTNSRIVDGRLYVIDSDGKNPRQLTFPSSF